MNKVYILVSMVVIVGLSTTGCASRDPNYGQARTQKRVNDPQQETGNMQGFGGLIQSLLR